MTEWTEQVGPDIRVRTARTKQSGPENRDRTAGTRLPGQDSKDRSARQVSLDRTEAQAGWSKAVQLEQDNRRRTTRKRQPTIRLLIWLKALLFEKLRALTFESV
jgi:hypothetical protein